MLLLKFFCFTLVSLFHVHFCGAYRLPKLQTAKAYDFKLGIDMIKLKERANLHISKALYMFGCCTKLLLMITLISASAIPYSQAAKNKVNISDVYYAGFGFLGRFDNIDAKFPHAKRLNTQNGTKIGELTALFTSRLKNTELKHLNVRFNLVDQNKKRPLMMALSVDREALVYRANKHPIAEISAQLIFFDYDSKTVVGNVHIPIAVNGLNTETSQAQIADLFDLGYLSETGLIGLAINKLKTLSIKDLRGVRVQVGNINISDKVRKALPRNVSSDIVEEFIGQYASVKLSEQKLNMIPFNKGATIGRQMAIRLMDTSAFNLVLPAPDYTVAIALNSTDTYEQKRLFMHGVQMGISIERVVARKKILDIPIFSVVHTRKGKQTGVVDKWAPFEDAIEDAMSNFSKQIKAPKSAWCEEHSSGKKACNQLKQFKQILAI